jgi:hypothetical protein
MAWLAFGTELAHHLAGGWIGAFASTTVRHRSWREGSYAQPMTNW